MPPPLTPEDVERILERVREGAVVRYGDDDDWGQLLYRDGGFLEQGFTEGRSWIGARSEWEVRRIVAEREELRILLVAPT